MIDVHVFDNSFREINIERGRISVEDKKKMFSELSELLDNNGKNGLNLIIKDIAIDYNNATANFDSGNNKWADDILGEICSYIVKESFSDNKERIDDVKMIVSNINEQLSDMFLTGQCASGRTIRFWQIYCSILDVEKERKSVEKKE